MAKTPGFRRGQSTFVCRQCGKRTRDVNGGNGNVELCELCDEKAMAGNSLADAGFRGTDPWYVFDACKTVREVEEKLTEELAKLCRNSRHSPDCTGGCPPDPEDE